MVLLLAAIISDIEGEIFLFTLYIYTSRKLQSTFSLRSHPPSVCSSRLYTFCLVAGRTCCCCCSCGSCCLLILLKESLSAHRPAIIVARGHKPANNNVIVRSGRRNSKKKTKNNNSRGETTLKTPTDTTMKNVVTRQKKSVTAVYIIRV